MVAPRYRSWTRALGEEDDGEAPEDSTPTIGESGSDMQAEPDYSFEGYSIEFIDKVALMQITLPAAATVTAQWRRTR